MADAPYDYDRTFFDPAHVEDRRAQDPVDEPADLRRDPVYVFSDEIVLAVNVALATRRPILVRGASGTGKSSLARVAAAVLGRRFYERVITSRTQARDLLYEIDLLRRLHDAQTGSIAASYQRYVLPGVLWWAFDAGSAAWAGAEPVRGQAPPFDDPSEVDHKAAVVLLDEIDKADPDVPNNLLVPLGSLTFEVEETGVRVATTPERAPLVFLTTNEERELPPAFLRRCVELRLPLPTRGRLLEIAEAHLPAMLAELGKGRKLTEEKARNRLREIADGLFDPADGNGEGEPLGVSPAEFLDTVRACFQLKITPRTKAWQALNRSTVWKFGRRPPGEVR